MHTFGRQEPLIDRRDPCCPTVSLRSSAPQALPLAVRDGDAAMAAVDAVMFHYQSRCCWNRSCWDGRTGCASRYRQSAAAPYEAGGVQQRAVMGTCPKRQIEQIVGVPPVSRTAKHQQIPTCCRHSDTRHQKLAITDMLNSLYPSARLPPRNRVNLSDVFPALTRCRMA